jgi:aminopeptidase YwaD
VLWVGREGRGGGRWGRVLRMRAGASRSTGSPLTVDSGPSPSDASTHRLVATVARLAADEYAGRRVGTDGARAAGRWLAGQLRALGAAVSIDEFPVAGVRDLYATPLLEWRDGAKRRLVHRRDFVEQLASVDLPAPRTGHLTTGDPATGDAGLWRDRWVLVPALTPDAAGRAHADGAAGLLVPRGVDGEGWMPKMIAGPGAGARGAGRPIWGDDRRRGRRRWRRGDRVGAAAHCGLHRLNVYGVFAERAAGGVSVLLTAHYDGVGDNPGQRLPAAADNASGVAVVLEAARLLASSLPDRMGLVVAFLDAEEAGAHGSAHHAGQVPPGTNVINVDGAARLGDAAAVEAGGPAHGLLAALDQAGRDTGVRLRAGAMASDNRRYAAAGLPAVGIGMGMPGYQTPAETPDRVDPATLVAATRLVTATVRQLGAAVR